MQGIYPADVLYALNTTILRKYSFIKNVTFDPNLSYETTLINRRTNTVFVPEVSEKNISELPMLSWNRDNSERSGRIHYIKCSSGLKNVDFVTAQFQYQFALFTTNVMDLEKFELDWLLRKGINSINSIGVKLKDPEEVFSFGVKWEDNLNSLTFSVDQNYYKSITGSATISGTFLVARDLTKEEVGSIIERVEFDISDCKGDQLYKGIINGK